MPRGDATETPAATASDNGTTATLDGSATSVARSATEYVPASVGVPVICPVAPFSSSPPGSAPEAADQVTLPLPPDAESAALYDTRSRPEGSAVVVTTTGATRMAI